MTAYEIIGEMAQQRYVEKLIASVLHVQKLTDTQRDLAQSVYESLLKTEAGRICRLWEDTDTAGQRQMDFYVVGIIKRQVSGTHSCWRDTYEGYSRRHIDITAREYRIADE